MKVSKTFIAYFLILIGGIIARYYIALNSTSGDLDFYLGLGGYQISLLGVDKSSYFIFLNFIQDTNTKKLALATIMTLLNLLAIHSIQKGFQRTAFTDILLAGLFSFFLIQIDMHLVRQQVGLYLFIYYMFSNHIYKRYFALGLSIYFHEVFLIFFTIYLIAPFISKHTRLNSKHDLIIFIALSTILYIIVQNISLILLIVISSLYLFLYTHRNFPLIYISLLMFINFLLIIFGIEDVFIERYIGVIASYIMLFLLFNRNIVNNFVQFRYFLKFSFLITYGIYFSYAV